MVLLLIHSLTTLRAGKIRVAKKKIFFKNEKLRLLFKVKVHGFNSSDRKS